MRLWVQSQDSKAGFRPQRSLQELLRKSSICVQSYIRGLSIPGSFYLGSTNFYLCPSHSWVKANFLRHCLPLHSEDTVLLLCFRYYPSLWPYTRCLHWFIRSLQKRWHTPLWGHAVRDTPVAVVWKQRQGNLLEKLWDEGSAYLSALL